MNAQHTPGPWEAELGTDGSFAIEAERQGIAGGLLVLASRNQHPLLADQMHANARLIAAAPDLLEALQDVMKYVAYAQRVVPPDLYYIGIDKARAAIAKATGSAA